MHVLLLERALQGEAERRARLGSPEGPRPQGKTRPRRNYHAGVDGGLFNVSRDAGDKRIPVFEVRIEIGLKGERDHQAAAGVAGGTPRSHPAPTW